MLAYQRGKNPSQSERNWLIPPVQNNCSRFLKAILHLCNQLMLCQIALGLHAAHQTSVSFFGDRACWGLLAAVIARNTKLQTCNLLQTQRTTICPQLRACNPSPPMRVHVMAARPPPPLHAKWGEAFLGKGKKHHAQPIYQPKCYHT